MRVRSLSTIGAVLMFLCGAGAAWCTSRSLTALCPLGSTFGNADLTSRGIYITGYPGNNLSQVEMAYVVNTVEGGGSSGNGQEIPLNRLGVTHGGLFWFFGADSPEVVVKILNPCVFDTHFWTFVTANTNVGFTITIVDTATSHTFSITNPDLNAAPPVQVTGHYPLTCP